LDIFWVAWIIPNAKVFPKFGTKPALNVPLVWPAMEEKTSPAMWWNANPAAAAKFFTAAPAFRIARL